MTGVHDERDSPESGSSHRFGRAAGPKREARMRGGQAAPGPAPESGYAGEMLTFAFVLSAVVVLLTGYVVVGDARTGMDASLLDQVMSWRGAGLTEFATVVTHLGGAVAMWTLALLACGWFARRGQWAEFGLVAGVGLGAAISVRVLKPLIGRERPPIEGRLVAVADPAYPSGHSLGSAAVVGVLAILAVWQVRRRPIAVTVMAGAVVFVGLVGLSRIYLGVHWPTDVLTGWAVGTLWVLLGAATYLRLAAASEAAMKTAEGIRTGRATGNAGSGLRRTCQVERPAATSIPTAYRPSLRS